MRHIRLGSWTAPPRHPATRGIMADMSGAFTLRLVARRHVDLGRMDAMLCRR